MLAVFKEMPPSSRYRETYLGDDAYREFQLSLIANPTAGAVMQMSDLTADERRSLKTMLQDELRARQ